MPGFAIHLAVGKQYIQKHKNQIKNEQEFIKGIIAPDLNEEMTQIERDKSKSHYGKWGNYRAITNMDLFLKDKKVNMTEDFWKGYFLHLITDYYFYNIDFKDEYEELIKNKDNLYYDYDCLNTSLKEQYKLNECEIEQIKKYMNNIDGQPKYLKIDKIINFIEKISNFDIELEVKIIKEKGMEGLK